MHLTPHEQERLLLSYAAELARRRQARGLKLNLPEATALVADHVLEGARDGVLVTELQGPDGRLELTDCLTLRAGADLGEQVPAGRGELLRLARVVSGTVEVDVRLRPLDGVQVREELGAWRLHWPAHPELDLAL